MAAADAAILQRFERLGMGSIKPAAGLAALAAVLSVPMPDAQARSKVSIALIYLAVETLRSANHTAVHLKRCLCDKCYYTFPVLLD